MSDLIQQVRSREWFYAYELPDGSTAPTYHGFDIQPIHDTRWNMLDACLSGHFGEERGNATVIDLACHQGWFATRVAESGFGRVLGVDARESHVDDSRLIASVYGLENTEFRQGDVHALDANETGSFDVVLMLGLLYHLENPVGALRTCRELCRDLCVIETQIVPGMTGHVDYGSYQYVKPLVGSFGIIDETTETHGPEASITGICLVPSLEALTWILLKVGFSEVEVLQPPADAYEQLKYHKRVMVAARV